MNDSCGRINNSETIRKNDSVKSVKKREEISYGKFSSLKEKIAGENK